MDTDRHPQRHARDIFADILNNSDEEQSPGPSRSSHRSSHRQHHNRQTSQSGSRDFGQLLDAIHIGSADAPYTRSVRTTGPFHSNDGSNTWGSYHQSHDDHPYHHHHHQRVQKRKRTDSDIGESALPKIRKVIQDQILRRDTASRNMTVITAYHAAAAQKSYGQEKRFLCPPPLIRISGPLVPHLRNQQLKMSVISELGTVLQEHVAQFDSEHGIVCFKQLHINSQGKDKQFQLALSIADYTTPEGEPIDFSRTPPKTPWAVLHSSPVHIISKPSKKTTRGNTPGITNMGTIALFNRINSQTVRTKYLSHRPDVSSTGASTSGSGALDANNHSGRVLTTSSSHWDVFTISLAQPETTGAPILYGSRVVLRAPGFQSNEYIIRKVEKQRSLSTDFGRQVSQMQKIALMRADMALVDGKVCYLSALVERPGNEPITVMPGSTHPTSWRFCDVRQETAEDGTVSEYHEVNDYATWMITSVGQFETAFFDASGVNTSPPHEPITPIPSVIHGARWVPSPKRDGQHSLHMGITNFWTFYPPLSGAESSSGASSSSSLIHSSNGSWVKSPLQVWIGDLGPLPFTAEEGAIGDGQQQHGFVFSASPVGTPGPNGTSSSSGGIVSNAGNPGPIIGNGIIVGSSTSTGSAPVSTGSTSTAGGGAGGGGGGSSNNNARLSSINLRDPPLATFVTVALPPMNELLDTMLDSIRTRHISRHHEGYRTPNRGDDGGGETMQLDRDVPGPSTSTHHFNQSRRQPPPPQQQQQQIMGMQEEGVCNEEEEKERLQLVLEGRHPSPSLPILFVRASPDGTGQRIGFHSGKELRFVSVAQQGIEHIDGWAIRIETTMGTSNSL
ncbi:hypothetical protein FRC20_006157 [Serendipita sp. 405]|nr:hypothetical protein FRC20_006157 [Serendipita sp. 405]